MKIIVDANKAYPTVEITIKCPEIDQNIKQLIKQMEAYELSFQAKKDERIYSLQAGQLFYVESIDNQTFMYTEDEVFESDLKLYEFKK